MEIKDLINKDNIFSESAFISKVDNIYIMLLSAIMMDDIEKVKHKLSSDLYNKYQEVAYSQVLCYYILILKEKFIC